MPPVEPALVLGGVTAARRFGRKQVTVLDGVSLEVWPGDVVAIVGARGAGKTTLLRVAAAIDRPAGGVVRLGAREIHSVSHGQRSEWRRRVAYVPKQWRVAHGKPAVDHVALPLLADGVSVRTAMREAEEALAWAGAGEHAHRHLPELPPAAATRVALARALVQKPAVLLLDEPGMNTTTEERVALLWLVRSMATLNPALAVLMTTLDTRGATGASRTVLLVNGRLRGAAPRPADVVPFPAGRSPAIREPAS
ncbi:MAG TPA: ATP-binding cassette domain-containing protein [Conexibacter sp.]|nr:ATP-binding cassette domain-containing protein [Conexibacter sp.]